MFAQEPIPRRHWLEAGVDPNTHTINCPTCGRVYVLKQDGTWESDRKLTILFEDLANRTDAEREKLRAMIKKIPVAPAIGSPRKEYKAYL